MTDSNPFSSTDKKIADRSGGAELGLGIVDEVKADNNHIVSVQPLTGSGTSTSFEAVVSHGNSGTVWLPTEGDMILYALTDNSAPIVLGSVPESPDDTPSYQPEDVIIDGLDVGDVGIDIEDDGTLTVSDSTAINFGENISVTDDGDTTVTVDGSGGGTSGIDIPISSDTLGTATASDFTGVDSLANPCIPVDGGDYLYAVDSGNEQYVAIDISDPSAITLHDTIAAPTAVDDENELYAHSDGEHLYHDHHVIVLSSDGTFSSTSDIGVLGASCGIVVGDYAFITYRGPSLWWSDVSTPTSPTSATEVGIAPNNDEQLGAIATDPDNSDIVWVNLAFSSDSLAVDISSPESPVPITGAQGPFETTLDTEQYAYDSIRDELYVTVPLFNKLSILDITVTEKGVDDTLSTPRRDAQSYAAFNGTSLWTIQSETESDLHIDGLVQEAGIQQINVEDGGFDIDPESGDFYILDEDSMHRMDSDGTIVWETAIDAALLDGGVAVSDGTIVYAHVYDVGTESRVQGYDKSDGTKVFDTVINSSDGTVENVRVGPNGNAYVTELFDDILYKIDSSGTIVDSTTFTDNLGGGLATTPTYIYIVVGDTLRQLDYTLTELNSVAAPFSDTSSSGLSGDDEDNVYFRSLGVSKIDSSLTEVWKYTRGSLCSDIQATPTGPVIFFEPSIGEVIKLDPDTGDELYLHTRYFSDTNLLFATSVGRAGPFSSYWST